MVTLSVHLLASFICLFVQVLEEMRVRVDPSASLSFVVSNDDFF